MNDFMKGFIKGAKETPAGFFAPLVAVWRILVAVTESLISKKEDGVNHHA
jgi:hypothetical protein